MEIIYASERNRERWERGGVPSPWTDVPVEVSMVEIDGESSGSAVSSSGASRQHCANLDQ
jgi:hypothetical protein